MKSEQRLSADLLDRQRRILPIVQGVAPAHHGGLPSGGDETE
jgi:hypothetical protein